MPTTAPSPVLPFPIEREEGGGLTAWGIPILRANDPSGLPTDPRGLHRGAASGDLVRIHPGVFAPSGPWNGAFPLQRHLATTLAIALTSRTTPVFCRETALALHGIPLERFPSVVTMRASSPAVAGWTPAAKPEGAKHPLFPIRRIRRPRRKVQRPEPNGTGTDGGGIGVGGTGAAVGDDGDDDGDLRQDLGHDAVLAAENLRRCLADTVPRMGLCESTVVLDAVMDGRTNGEVGRTSRRRQGWSRDDVLSLGRLIGPAATRTRFEAAVRFASGVSESAGESFSRARIHELGFAAPELQHPVHAANGLLLGEGDFWWRDVRVMGEFDGKGKYAGATSYSGHSAAAVVYAEKLREDRIREEGIRFVRWGWDDVRSPSRLEDKLLRAGVPRP